jgi:hypothetical protein
LATSRHPVLRFQPEASHFSHLSRVALEKLTLGGQNLSIFWCHSQGETAIFGSSLFSVARERV